MTDARGSVVGHAPIRRIGGYARRALNKGPSAQPNARAVQPHTVMEVWAHDVSHPGGRQITDSLPKHYGPRADRRIHPVPLEAIRSWCDASANRPSATITATASHWLKDIAGISP